MNGQLPVGEVLGRRGMGVVTVDWTESGGGGGCRRCDLARKTRGGLPEKAPLTWDGQDRCLT